MSFTCKICGNLLAYPTYRQLYPHFNFPAHSTADWDTCKKGLLARNLQPVYADLPAYLEAAPHLTHDYKEIKDLLTDPSSNFDLLLQIDALGEMLASAFPDAAITEPEIFIPSELQLDKATYQKLVAHEIESNTTSPSLLKNTSVEILTELEIGGFEINSPFYYGTIPTGRSFQSVRVPAELVKALRQPWISRDHSLERLYMAYAERLTVLEKNEDIAYLIIRNDIRPSAVRRKARALPVSATINYVQVPNLPQDKRRGIRKALQRLDEGFIARTAMELGEGKMSSARVDYEDRLQVRSLAKELGLPAYKVTTALLLLANYVKV